MLSKLQFASTQIFRKFVAPNRTGATNIVAKRWSGHNAMEIVPTSSDRLHVKNWLHFYFVAVTVPVAVITAIIHIRANPELTEIPEGYEPRDWEYYRHPLTRLMARYLYTPMEWEQELQMGLLEVHAENKMIVQVENRVKEVMAFYNDHRSMFYEPYYADYVRIGRDQLLFGQALVNSNPNTYYEAAHDPDVNPVPIEGYTK